MGADGTIDWFCCPRFDPPSVFVSLPDAERGGAWQIAPTDGGVAPAAPHHPHHRLPWYVEALTRSGRLDDARLALEKMFTYANHLGLHAEPVGATGEQLGYILRRSRTSP